MTQPILWAVLAAEAVFIIVIIIRIIRKNRSRYDDNENEEKVALTLSEEKPLDENLDFLERDEAEPTQEK